MKLGLMLLCVALGLAVLPVEAASLSSEAQIDFLDGRPHSCQIFRQRLIARAKGHKGLRAHLTSLETKSRWTRADYEVLQSLLGRSGFASPSFRERRILLTWIWDLSQLQDWQARLNSKERLSVEWTFKDREWSDENGILPSDLRPIWDPSTNLLKMQYTISAVQLCCDANVFSLSIDHSLSGDRLHLTSNVVWP